jgi:hypothetical protein
MVQFHTIPRKHLILYAFRTLMDELKTSTLFTGITKMNAWPDRLQTQGSTTTPLTDTRLKPPLILLQPGMTSVEEITRLGQYESEQVYNENLLTEFTEYLFRVRVHIPFEFHLVGRHASDLYDLKGRLDQFLGMRHIYDPLTETPLPEVNLPQMFSTLIKDYSTTVPTTSDLRYAWRYDDLGMNYAEIAVTENDWRNSLLEVMGWIDYTTPVDYATLESFTQDLQPQEL